MDIYRMCRAITRAGDTLFRYPFPRDGELTGLVGLRVTTTSARPPLSTLVRDLGRLHITIGTRTVCVIPIPVLVAICSHIDTTESNHLALSFDLSPFVGDMPMTEIFWDTPFVDLHVGSKTHVLAIEFVFRCRRRLRCPRRFSIHQLLTQTRMNPTPMRTFIFPIHLGSRPLKGVLLDEYPSEVRLIDNAGNEYPFAGAHEMVGHDHVFVGMDPHSTFGAWSAEGMTAATAYVKVRYAEPQTCATIHCITENEVLLHHGMVIMHPAATHGGAGLENPILWEDAYKPRPDNAECPITYAPIGSVYYECADCHYAFDANAFRQYAATVGTLTCPMCRRTWSRRVQYHTSAAAT